MGTHKIDIFGIMESMFDDKALQYKLRFLFKDMKAIHNFSLNTKGRNLVLWNPCSVDVDVDVCVIKLYTSVSFVQRLNPLFVFLLFVVITTLFFEEDCGII